MFSFVTTRDTSSPWFGLSSNAWPGKKEKKKKSDNASQEK